MTTQTTNVFDVNVLRREEVVGAFIAHWKRTNEMIALPEIALFELTKHPDKWEDTVRRSFQLISQCPASVVITRAVRPLALKEESSGEPTRTMVDPVQTGVFRKILEDVARGGGADFDYLIKAIRQYRIQLEHERHAADSLLTMQALKSSSVQSIPPDMRARSSKDLAKGDRTSFQELLREALRIDSIREAHVRRGVRAEIAAALTLEPSVSYLFPLAIGALGLGWLFEGGVESASPGRAANDVLDIEYLIAALWSGQLISRDGRSRDRFEDLKALGAACWPSHANWFARAKAFDSGEAVLELMNRR